MLSVSRVTSNTSQHPVMGQYLPDSYVFGAVNLNVKDGSSSFGPTVSIAAPLLKDELRIPGLSLFTLSQ
jgi:hypothetical protein